MAATDAMDTAQAKAQAYFDQDAAGESPLSPLALSVKYTLASLDAIIAYLKTLL